jgi:mannobiose 2-epimerase
MNRTAALALALVLPALTAAAAPPPADVRLADEMDAYLLKHALAPRFPAVIDRENGGFHANFGPDWAKLPDRHRFIVYQARMTWTPAFLALTRPSLRDEHLAYVRHGVAFLRDRMWDAKNGGFHTGVLLDGTPDPSYGGVKTCYGQAFAIYALAVAHRATKDAATLDLARRGWEWVEKHARDDGKPGYRSAVRADGGLIPDPPEGTQPRRDVPGGGGLPTSYRDMNTHIHLLEAWTELLKEWPDPRLRASTEQLFELVRDRFYSEPGTLHLYLDGSGHPIAGPSSFGHDVETGFLLLEAAEALGIHDDPAAARVARRFVDHALALGWNDETGQLYEEGCGLRPAHDRSIQWWAQFEMWNALSVLDQLFGKETPRYREALDKAWRFTKEKLTDPVHGGVQGGVDEHGKAVPAKSHDWKAEYHTVRSLVMTADRLRRGRH